MTTATLLRPILLIGVLIAGGIGVAGCNTIEGMGKDVQAAGSAISGTAEETKENISN